MASPIHRIKLVISFDQGIQCTLWPDPDAQIMSYILLGSCVVALSRKESKFIAPFNTERSTQFRTHSKPDQRIQAIADSQPHLSQQSYPTILSLWQASLCPFSEFKQLPCPKIDHNSRSHPPNKHSQKLKLMWLVKNCICQNKYTHSRREAPLLKWADTNIRNHEK